MYTFSYIMSFIVHQALKYCNCKHINESNNTSFSNTCTLCSLFKVTLLYYVPCSKWQSCTMFLVQSDSFVLCSLFKVTVLYYVPCSKWQFCTIFLVQSYSFVLCSLFKVTVLYYVPCSKWQFCTMFLVQSDSFLQNNQQNYCWTQLITTSVH